jgi:putative component of toxin-antitoxin plasmid stabilization module
MPLQRAIETARRAHAKATGSWHDSDEAQEAEQHAKTAVDHLDAGRFDDAQAMAELALSLEEEHGPGDVWREFSLLVEEACELGRDQ